MYVQSRRKTMKTLKTIIFALASAFILTGCFGSNTNGDKNGGDNKQSKTTFTLGETFTFDNLDLTFSPDIVYTRLNNYGDQYHKHEMFIMPVTITNKGSKPNMLSFLSYECYCPNGSEAKNLSAYYYDDPTSVDWGGNIQSGVTATRNLYFLYGGDGSYSLVLDNYSTKLTVNFNVKFVEPAPEPDAELDKAFTYEDMELTFSSSYSIVIYQPSQYSTPRDVVKMPVTVKNNGTKANHLDYLDMKTFGPSGVQITDMNAYYYDQDAVEFAGDLQPGASYTKSMYFEYIGDGQYQIDFGTFETEKSLKFNIQKS